MTTGDFDPAKAGMVWSDATGWTLGPNVPLYFPSEEMQTQLTAALARIARLEEAAWPFLRAAELIEKRPQDYGPQRIASFGGLDAAHDIYPEDFLRLRATLASAQPNPLAAKETP